MAPQLMAEQGLQRHTAVKTWIGNILHGVYLVKEGNEPNVLLAGSQKMSRVNLIGVIVAKNDEQSAPTLLLDDGSGRIVVRSFEEQSQLSKHTIGDMVTLIGRPREFGQEKYVVPEIIKKIDDAAWIELRKLELENIQKITKQTEITPEKKTPLKTETKMADEQQSRLIAEEKIIIPTQSKERKGIINATEIIEVEDIGGAPKNKIIKLIQKLDYGNGVEISDVIKKAEVNNGEKIVKNLILQGDIFEVKPGKVKVLE